MSEKRSLWIAVPLLMAGLVFLSVLFGFGDLVEAQIEVPPLQLCGWPYAGEVTVGEVFTKELRLTETSRGSQLVDGAAIYWNFDPTYLRVITVTAGSALPVVSVNTFDNISGTIDFLASSDEAVSVGDITLVTVEFQAVASTLGLPIGATGLAFDIVPPRKTRVTHQGDAIGLMTCSIVIRIVPEGYQSPTPTVTPTATPTATPTPTPTATPTPHWIEVDGNLIKGIGTCSGNWLNDDQGDFMMWVLWRDILDPIPDESWVTLKGWSWVPPQCPNQPGIDPVEVVTPSTPTPTIGPSPTPRPTAVPQAQGWKRYSESTTVCGKHHYLIDRLDLVTRRRTGLRAGSHFDFEWPPLEGRYVGVWGSWMYDLGADCAFLVVGEIREIEPPCWFFDVDDDGDVDVVDIMLVANRWRCGEGDECYEEVYDLNHDGDIDIVDIMLVAAHWGETCS